MKTNYNPSLKAILIAAVFMFLGYQGFTQNPIVTHIYTADPTARVFDGKLYVYPSHDVDVCNELQGSNKFCMPDYHMFSTEDLVNWKDHGVIMDQNEVPWGAKDQYGMWAPDCIYKDGTYYYYYPGIPEDKSAFRRIGIATSKNPTGPFKQVNHYIKGVKGIDPGLFIDDDGQAYIYYGGGTGKGALKAAKLKDNMVEIEGKPKAVEGIIYESYREASFLFKRKGIYYFTYARVGKNNYQIEYATSTNPMGPFEYKGVAMENIGRGTNHHSFVEYKGQWYLFYHDWSISDNNRLRSICVDKMEFNKNGSIATVKPTLRGIGTPKAGDIIQVDRHNGISKAKVSVVEGNQPRGFQLHYIENDGWVKFDRVNFGDGSLKELKVRASTGSSGGKLELRTGSKDGPLLATVNIENTGNWKTWKTFTSTFTGTTKGVQDIVCVFKGTDKYLFNLNWIKFSASDVPGSDKTIPYELEGAPAPSVKNEISAADLEKIPKKRGEEVAKIGEVIHIDEHNGIHNARIAPTQPPQPKGFKVGHINDQGWLKYDRVDFGNGELSEFRAMVSAGEGGGTLELRLDSKDGPVLASIDIANTGGWNKWKLMSAPFIKQAQGLNNIVCTFKGNGSNLFDVNWIRILSNTMPKNLIKHPLEKGYSVAKAPKEEPKRNKKKNEYPKAGDIIEIDQHSGIENARIIPANKGKEGEKEVGYINDGGWIKYEKVDFGKGKLNTIKAMVRSGSQGGILEIRIDDKTGPVLASIQIPNTGGWKTWKLVSAPITTDAQGVKDMYCLFKGNGKNLYNVNWLRFSSNAVPSSKKPHPLEKDYIIVDTSTKEVKKEKKKKSRYPKAGDIIEIDQHSGIDNARIIPANKGKKGEEEVGYINDGGWIKYEKVDFGKGKLKTIKAMVRSGSQGGILEIRIDDKTGPVLASIQIPNTGGWKTWKLVSAPIKTDALGIKDMYCLFKGNGKNLYNVNWLRFSSDAVPSSKKPHSLEKNVASVASSGNSKPGAETPQERGRRVRDIPKGKKLGMPLGQIIAIKASNGKYLSVQKEELTASADVVGVNERFTVLSEGGDLVSFKSMATKKIFSSRLNQPGIPVIVSRAGDAKSWEKFTWRKLGDVQFTVVANNGNLVQLKDDQSGFTADKGARLNIKAVFVFEIVK